MFVLIYLVTPSEMAQATATGSCLCNGVQYTISGTDKGAVLCHCTNCRKASGGAFMHNTRFMNADVKYQKGAEMMKKYDDRDTKTGNHLYRYFCGNCVCSPFAPCAAVLDTRLTKDQGSPIFLQSAAVPGLIVAHCGLFDDNEPRKPKFELFEQDRRAWMVKIGGAKM